MWTHGQTRTHGPFESPVVAPITALVRLLDDLLDVVDRVPDQAFSRPVAGRPTGTIGAHVRHCLDHVDAFVSGIAHGRVCYDRRARGTPDESSRAAAIARIRALTDAVLDLDPRVMVMRVTLDVRLDTRGTTVTVASTVARELAFVINHTIHHNATMALLLAEVGVDLPSRFGVAPSTPARPTAAQALAGAIDRPTSGSVAVPA